tara:strand:- start:45 stop:1466 length:1422 start_codon:yes stop_codon:yes gene_type:complete
MDDEEAKRIQEERDNQLTEEYKELQNPKKPEEKEVDLVEIAKRKNPNYLSIIEEIWQDTKEFKPWYQPGENIGALGARAIESVIPTNYKELQQELVELKSAGKLYPAKKLVGEIPFVKQGLETVSRKMDDWLWNPMFSKANRVATEGSPNYMMSEQTERMATGFKENIDKIPKKNRATDFELIGSDVDNLAKVTKPKIKKLVKQFGGTSDDVDAIFQEQVVKMQSQLRSKTWLNQYFNDLTKGLGPDGLKNARIKDVNGKPTLVDGRTLKTIDHPFEVDHQKAKELMNKLGLEGADMHENLEIVYSVFNRAKNNIGNPALPDKLLEAVGQSTTLKDFVQRRLDKAFDLNYQRVPQRFRDVAKVNLMDDILDAKPGVKLEVTIEKRLKFYDKFSNLLVQIDDYVPPKVQRQLDTVYRDLNPQEYLQQLKDLGVYDRLTGRLKRLHEKLSDDWINLKRGLRSRPTDKYMKPGHDV